MNTPLADFLNAYRDGSALRLHMPGHKGRGGENTACDITEISGADSLYEASGILLESERNASEIFGCHTFFSTEGSSLALRAMLYLACIYATERGERPLIWAARNCHRSFLSAAALLDFDLDWLMPEKTPSYLSCPLSAEEVDARLANAARRPTAVFLTSPDYLGGMQDIRGIAAACHKWGVLLLVDNAHGAYLRFLSPSLHPCDLGADACCDSAHKTLPVLTGGAYLQISKTAPAVFTERAKSALVLFGSTSPSYLILKSLDLVNKTLAEGYPARQAAFLSRLASLKATLARAGYAFYGEEPMKLMVRANAYGYTGKELAALLEERGVMPEFSDPDYLVLMPSPSLTEDDLARLEKTLLAIPKKKKMLAEPPVLAELPKRAMTPREALFAPSETLPTDACLGRVFASAALGCPPAVPLTVAGEVISENTLEAFAYYGIRECRVVK